jgi:hypothetical protein
MSGEKEQKHHGFSLYPLLSTLYPLPFFASRVLETP